MLEPQTEQVILLACLFIIIAHALFKEIILPLLVPYLPSSWIDTLIELQWISFD